MTISSQQIHSILRTYGKQLSRSARLNKVRSTEAEQTAEPVKVSAEAKRNQVVERVAAELIARLTNPEVQKDGVGRQVMDALQEEYGQPLRVAFQKSTGRFAFSVVDVEKGEVSGTVTGKDAEQLERRLVEITRQIVDSNML